MHLCVQFVEFLVCLSLACSAQRNWILDFNSKWTNQLRNQNSTFFSTFSFLLLYKTHKIKIPKNDKISKKIFNKNKSHNTSKVHSRPSFLEFSFRLNFSCFFFISEKFFSCVPQMGNGFVAFGVSTSSTKCSSVFINSRFGFSFRI